VRRWRRARWPAANKALGASVGGGFGRGGEAVWGCKCAGVLIAARGREGEERGNVGEAGGARRGHGGGRLEVGDGER
jgi:hypothetical protein